MKTHALRVLGRDTGAAPSRSAPKQKMRPLLMAVIVPGCMSGIGGTPSEQELRIEDAAFPDKFLVKYNGDMDDERAGTFEVMTVPLDGGAATRTMSFFVQCGANGVQLRNPWRYLHTKGILQFTAPRGELVNISRNPSEIQAATWRYVDEQPLQYQVVNTSNWPIELMRIDQLTGESELLTAVDEKDYNSEMANSTDNLLAPQNERSTLFKIKREDVVFETSIMNQNPNQKNKLPMYAISHGDTLRLTLSIGETECKFVLSC